MNRTGRVISFKTQSGGGDISIVDENFIPLCPFLTTFLEHYKTLNTKKSYANQLLFIHRYFVTKSIDLPSRIRDGRYLTIEEYEGLHRHCHYKKSEWMGNGGNVSSFTQFRDKQLDKLIHASRAADDKVINNTVKIRLTLLIEYIEHLHYMHHFSCNPGSEAQHKFDLLIHKAKKDRKLLKEENSQVRDPNESVLSDEIFDQLVRTIDPSSPDNPFTNTARTRNYLIVKLVMEGGLRRGAVAKIKLSDVHDDWHNPRIRITRTPNDPTDPRKDIPSQKTKQHVVPVSKDTMKKLLNYVENIRASFTDSIQHEFVFVSEKGTCGQPLTLAGFDYIFTKIGKNLGIHLTPHMLRHKWNEQFDDAAEKLGISGEQREDIRKGAMGWSENSNMGAIYNSKNLAVKAQKIHQEMQSAQINRLACD